MTEREVRFRITETRSNGRRRISVHPTLHNIFRAEGGEGILLAIAANCVRTLARTDGLERAMERFQDVVLNHTTVTRQ